jgi:hypothetical protein
MLFFDRFAGIVEKWFQNLIPIIQKTKLFVFAGRAHEVLPRWISEEEMRKIEEEFFLPFPNVAIEDTLSLIVMWDVVKDQRGLHCERHFMEYMEFGVPMTEADSETDRLLSHDLPNWPSDVEFKEARKKIDPRTAMITHGIINDSILTGNLDTHGQPEVIHEYQVMEGCIVHPDGSIDPMESILDKEGITSTVKATTRNAWVAMKEIWYFNSPDKFILEERPDNSDRTMTKALKLGKIARRHQRPTYTILHPQTIRQRLHLPPLTHGGPKSPHERRAHRRTFHSDKFWRMKGKSIIIPAAWIGPSEAKVGKKIYRVLLDK